MLLTEYCETGCTGGHVIHSVPVRITGEFVIVGSQTLARVKVRGRENEW